MYCTAIDNERVLSDLYQEWLGHAPQFKGIGVNTRWIVAKDGDRYIGAACLITIQDVIWDRTWGLVENVYVASDYRKQGVAKALMYAIEQAAQLVGCQFIKLTSAYDKEAGHALYKSMNYTEGLSFKKHLKSV